MRISKSGLKNSHFFISPIANAIRHDGKPIIFLTQNLSDVRTFDTATILSSPTSPWASPWPIWRARCAVTSHRAQLAQRQAARAVVVSRVHAPVPHGTRRAVPADGIFLHSRKTWHRARRHGRACRAPAKKELQITDLRRNDFDKLKRHQQNRQPDQLPPHRARFPHSTLARALHFLYRMKPTATTAAPVILTHEWTQ